MYSISDLQYYSIFMCHFPCILYDMIIPTQQQKCSKIVLAVASAVFIILPRLCSVDHVIYSEREEGGESQCRQKSFWFKEFVVFELIRTNAIPFLNKIIRLG